MHRFLFLAAAATIVIAPCAVQAAESRQDEKKEKEIALEHSYSPEHCQFKVAFPEKPSVERQCEQSGDAESCYDLVTFNKVFDMNASVSFRIICNASDKELFEAYDEQLMTKTLEAMTKGSVIQQFNASYREREGYKIAGLIGEGKMGVVPTIYIGQLWIAHKSLLSMEAQLVGPQHSEADKLYSEILKSITFLDDEEKAAENKAANDDKAEPDKPVKASDTKESGKAAGND